MKHLGLLLVGAHYPEVSSDPGALDGQLRRYLAALECAPESILVFKCYRGDIPALNQCEAWVASGSPLLWEAGTTAYKALLHLVTHESRMRRPIFGLNHGEQVLTDALCADTGSPALPRSLRNPFRSFWVSDVLYQVNGGQLVKAPRPTRTRDYFLPMVA